LQYGVQSEQTGVGEIDGFCRMTYAAPEQPIPATIDPADMFDRMFATGVVGSETLQVARAQRRSVLDLVMDDFTRLEGRVGARDKQVLDAHLSAIRELELALSMTQPTPESCGVDPEYANVADPVDPMAFPTIGRQQMDLLRIALQCDITRIASL